MTGIALEFVVVSVALALLCAAVPNRWLPYALPLTGALGIVLIAPWSLVWILVLTAGLSGLHALPVNPGLRLRGLLLFVGAATAALLWLRELTWLETLGAAYFSLRAIHVALDVWMSRYSIPKPLPLLGYMLFFPVFLVGPIHRYPDFARTLQRRRQSAQDLFAGFERVLVGIFVTVVLGGWLINLSQEIASGWNHALHPFLLDWLYSVIGWVDLYFVFGGMSAVAIGAARIIGLEVQENFNRPFLARSLAEFWTRWHISLTSWCRDYVYQPVSSMLRNHVVGVFASMLVLGLWHETSLYYILWAAWQALGIVLSRRLTPVYNALPSRLDILLSPFLVLAWLSLAKPIATRIDAAIWTLL